MTKQEFMEELQDILEIDELTEDQDFSTVAEFDSLAIMSIVAVTYSTFQIKLTGAEIGNVKTPNELISLIGIEKFEG